MQALLAEKMKKETALKISHGYLKNTRARPNKTPLIAHTSMKMTSGVMRPKRHSNKFWAPWSTKSGKMRIFKTNARRGAKARERMPKQLRKLKIIRLRIGKQAKLDTLSLLSSQNMDKQWGTLIQIPQDTTDQCLIEPGCLTKSMVNHRDHYPLVWIKTGQACVWKSNQVQLVSPAPSSTTAISFAMSWLLKVLIRLTNFILQLHAYARRLVEEQKNPWNLKHQDTNRLLICWFLMARASMSLIKVIPPQLSNKLFSKKILLKWIANNPKEQIQITK